MAGGHRDSFDDECHNGNADKHARSEALRQASLRARREQTRVREQLISATLREVDTPRSKRIVFGVEDDEMTTRKKTATTNGYKEKGHKLFDEDSDEETVDLDKLKNRHRGPAGEQLAALEARFGSDTRFRIDERFMEEGRDNAGGEGTAEDRERSAEKKAELAILSRVLGTPVDLSTTSTKKKTTHRGLFVRFNPNNPDHVRMFEKRAAPDDERKASSREEAEENEEDDGERKAIVLPGRFADVDPQFASQLREKLTGQNPAEKTQFCFLATIDQAKEEKMAGNGSAKKEDASYKVTNIPRARHLVDSSDDDDHRPDSGKEVETAHASTSTASSRPWFFVDAEDATIAKEIARFRRTQPVETVKKKWTQIRSSIVKIYKRERKEAMKQLKVDEKERWRSANGVDRRHHTGKKTIDAKEMTEKIARGKGNDEEKMAKIVDEQAAMPRRTRKRRKTGISKEKG